MVPGSGSAPRVPQPPAATIAKSTTGTAAFSVNADRRGFDGPIHLTIPNPPKGISVEGGIIPREYMDASNTRTINRRGVLLLSADRDITLSADHLEIWGEAALADGTVLKRRARGLGMIVDVSGATDQGVVDRQRSLNAPWLGLELPVALGDPPSATLAVKQTTLKHLEEGDRYEYAYEWTVKGRGTPPNSVGVEVIGAKDLRVIDIKAAPGMMTGTFAVTTTKATDPARYDLYITGRLRTDEGDELILSRPIPFDVTGGTNGK